jgi:hypothetical protein
MAVADSLREGMVIGVRVRVRKYYENPAVVTLSLGRYAPSVLVRVEDLEWWPPDEAPGRGAPSR